MTTYYLGDYNDRCKLDLDRAEALLAGKTFEIGMAYYARDYEGTVWTGEVKVMFVSPETKDEALADANEYCGEMVDMDGEWRVRDSRLHEPVGVIAPPLCDDAYKPFDVDLLLNTLARLTKTDAATHLRG